MATTSTQPSATPQPSVTLPNIDSQYTTYKSAIDTRSQEAEREFNNYKNNINSKSQEATSKLTRYNNEVDALTRDLNKKKTDFQSSSSIMTTALALYKELQTSVNTTIKDLISRATTNITNTEETNKLAKKELESIKTKNLQASSDASITAGHLATTKKAAADALLAKGVTDQHKADAQGYSLAASKHASTAANFERLTKEELDKAIATNVLINEQYELAEELLQYTANDLTSAGGPAIADLILKIREKRNKAKNAKNSKETFTNNREGLDNNDFTSDELRLLAGAISAQDRENLSQRRLLQVSELLTQKDTVANNIIMDYMYKNEKGTNVSTIMDRVGQLNNDKKRKLEITTYYNKAREKYINILKVIVLACIIIVPLVIANKNNIIPNSIFMFSTVAIIFLTIIFTFSSFVDIYKRDNLDFDKYNIPYNREAAMLEKDGSIIRKKNPLTSLTLTCIGQDCCDGSMVYDKAKNKCIATENFGNIFETMAIMNNKKSTVYPNTEGFVNNCNFKNTMIQNSLGCSSVDKFITNECANTLQMQF
jgi:hypothetical protein